MKTEEFVSMIYHKPMPPYMKELFDIIDSGNKVAVHRPRITFCDMLRWQQEATDKLLVEMLKTKPDN